MIEFAPIVTQLRRPTLDDFSHRLERIAKFQPSSKRCHLLERKPNRPLSAQFPSRFQHLLVTRTKNPDVGFNREMRKTAAL